jgi:hypothetical protein
MIGLIYATLFSAPAYASCALPLIEGAAVTVGIQVHGHQFGGMGIVTLHDQDWSLTLLSPGGLKMFSAQGRYAADSPELPGTITTGLDAWRPWLEALPFGRDLRTAFATTDGACGSGGTGGQLHTRVHTFKADGVETIGWQRCWRGSGGKAYAELLPGRIVLHDRRRGYTLTIVIPDRALPLLGSPEGSS